MTCDAKIEEKIKEISNVYNINLMLIFFVVFTAIIVKYNGFILLFLQVGSFPHISTLHLQEVA